MCLAVVGPHERLKRTDYLLVPGVEALPLYSKVLGGLPEHW